MARHFPLMEPPISVEAMTKAVQQCLADMENGNVDAVILMNANPAYELPNGEAFANALGNIALTISCNRYLDESAVQCKYVAPDHHMLESWGDVMAKEGELGLVQPTIAPLHDTRKAEESLLHWAQAEGYDATADQPYYEFLKSNWQSEYFAGQNKFSTFQAFWDSSLL